MIAVKIVVVALVGVVMLLVLKNTAPVYVVIAQLGLVAVILLTVVPQIQELLSVLTGFELPDNFSTQSIKIMLKIFAILTAGSIAADICRDNGQNAVADTVELAVKTVAVSCALPVFTAIITVASSFFNR